MEAMFAHMHNFYGTNSSETIQYVEIGNEPNHCQEWFHKDGIAAGSDSGPCAPDGSINPPATAKDLVREAADVRAIANSSTLNQTGVVPKIVSGGLVGDGSFEGYMSTILNDMWNMNIPGGSGGTTNQFDLYGFHGYYTPAIPSSSNFGFCTNDPASGGTVLNNCPVPETFTQVWQGFFWTLTNAITCGTLTTCDPYYNKNTMTGLLPTIDTEFSWGDGTNVVNGDQRAALAARSYILQAEFYPEISQVGWYGEDFAQVPFSCPGAPNCTSTGGGTGQFWNPTSVASNPDTDLCTTAAATQGGFICQAGIAMEVVNKWLGNTPSVGRGFVSAAPQTCTCTGSSCSATPPLGTWACPLALSGVPSYVGEIVWDNTQTKFPCSTTSYPKACGSTLYTLPSTFTGSHAATSQWQTLDGTTPSAIGSHQTSVGIGAKPILIENQKVATKVTPVD
jgi:hypothetical protein